MKNKKIAVFMLFLVLFGSIMPSYAISESHTIDIEQNLAPPKYTVKFYNAFNTVISTQMIKKNNSAIAPSSTPTKTGHTFDGWDTDFTSVTNNLNIYPTFVQDNLECTVTFEDYDGTVLKTETILEYEDATPPSNPIRTGYTFTGWDNSYTNVNSDLTVTAQYSQNAVSYTVDFVDYDGTNLKTETVVENTSATAPTNPMRVGYTFNGWDTSFDNITSNTTVTATYLLGTPAEYDVEFVDYDGTVLNTETVIEGNGATAPSNPSRASHIFTGWDTDFSNITSNTTVTAEYIPTGTTFVVTFKDYDGVTLESAFVLSGEDAIPPSEPTRSGYVFSGWDANYTNVIGNLTVKATYTEDSGINNEVGVTIDGTLIIDSKVPIDADVQSNTDDVFISKKSTVNGDIYMDPTKTLVVEGTFNGTRKDINDKYKYVEWDYEEIVKNLNHESSPSTLFSKHYIIDEETHYDSIDISGSEKLTFDTSSGDLYVFADTFEVSGNGVVEITGGNRVFLFTKDLGNMKGTVDINLTGNVQDLIILTQEDTFFSIQGNSSNNFGLYAPNADVTMGGNTDFEGAVFAKTLNVGSNASVGGTNVDFTNKYFVTAPNNTIDDSILDSIKTLDFQVILKVAKDGENKKLGASLKAYENMLTQIDSTDKNKSLDRTKKLMDIFGEKYTPNLKYGIYNLYNDYDYLGGS